MSTFNTTLINSVVTAAKAEKQSVAAAVAATDAAIGRALDVVAALCAATAKREKTAWADAVAQVIGKSARTNPARADVSALMAALCAATAKREKTAWADAVACVVGKSARTNPVRADVATMMAAAGEAAGWQPATCRQMAAAFFACLQAREGFSRGFLANRPRKPRPPADRAVAAAVAMVTALHEGGVPPEKIRGLVKTLRTVGVEVEYTP